MSIGGYGPTGAAQPYALSMPNETLGVPSVYIGAGAGVLTSLLWVLTSLFFSAAGQRISVTALNTIRIVVAILLLGLMHLAFFGTPVPQVTDSRQLLALALSGLIGLSLCDQALFTAFMDIGPRRALLFMTTSPIFALFFGAAFLREHVLPVAFVGIAITIAGVLLVILERGPAGGETDRPVRPARFRRGIVLALIAAVSQAAGSMFSKLGMGIGWLQPDQQMPTVSATLVRMVFGLFGMAPIVLIYVVMLRRNGTNGRPTRWKSGVALTACGAFVGPFLGVWMSLVAFKHSPIGVAQTLASLSPVFILPFSHYLLGDHVSKRALAGAVVALMGAGLLAFAPALHGALGW